MLLESDEWCRIKAVVDSVDFALDLLSGSVPRSFPISEGEHNTEFMKDRPRRAWPHVDGGKAERKPYTNI